MATPPWEWPPGTGDKLLAVLRDERAGEADLELAIGLASSITVIDDELAEALLAVLGSDGRSEEARGQAAISLGPVLEEADIHGFEDPEEVPITEATFNRICETLRRVHLDPAVPIDVRRRALEASVRAPQDWHRDAIGAALSSDAPAWQLTAVFCMAYVRGFDAQILEALESEDPEVHYQAVRASGSWGLEGAWSHVTGLLTSGDIDKPLLLTAIEAVAAIRPHEAPTVLVELLELDDEEIVEAVHETIAMAEALREMDADGEGDDELYWDEAGAGGEGDDELVH